MTWELLPDGRRRCKTHDPKCERPFGARESCPGADGKPCTAFAVLDASDEQPQPPPKGCLSTEQVEAKLVDLAEFIEKQSRGLCKGAKNRINHATAFKGFDLAIKAYTAAGDYARTRERKDNVRRLERLKRAAMHARRHRGGTN